MISWITPAGFLTTASELTSINIAVVATGTDISYSLINGDLPAGLNFNNGVISGIPSPVLSPVRSRFTIRAKNTNGVKDRTFFMDVEGADTPVWNTVSITATSITTTSYTLTNVTSGGFLPLGYNGEPYAMNKQYIDFDLTANAVAAPSGTELKFYIADGDGKLPPGLTLTESGKIVGIINDILSFDGDASDTGGFDDESYDAYSYDHALSTSSYVPIVFFPKVYQFRITATDGVASQKTLFKILVTSPDMFRADSGLLPSGIPELDLGILVNSISYLQPPQFINGNDLGTVRAENNDDISVQAYDPNPIVGTLTYALVTGTTVTTRLPYGLQLDSQTGYIYGYLPYQPAYTQNYNLTVQATKIDYRTATRVTATNTFTLAVKGEVETSIEWKTGSNLGTVETGIVSELAVEAVQTDSDYNIKYQLVNGTIPPGLELARDGSLFGKVNYGSTGTYTFTVLASDVYELSSIEREFSVTVVEYDSREYTEIFCRPFLSREKRNQYRDFITDTFTFDPKLMYRYFDPNFGVQHDIKMVIEFGIERVDLEYYTVALRENFYRKRLYFGDVKKAVAKDSTGSVIYEIIYVDAVDDMVNNEGESVSRIYYSGNDIYYPGSVENQRLQLQTIPLENGSYIGINEFNQPRFMRTAQAGDYKPPYYMRVIPICYALPGQGDRIISRIKLSGFDFKKLDFEVDRIVVQNSKDNSTAKYLLLERQALGDEIATDNQLFGPDWALSPELTVRIDDENNQPLNRK